jgi:hypothetical protein
MDGILTMEFKKGMSEKAALFRVKAAALPGLDGVIPDNASESAKHE